MQKTIVRAPTRLMALLALALLIGVMPAAWAQEEVIYYHTDALGTPVAITDQSGNVIERREFEPYGHQLQPATLADGPGYTGHVSDAATGLSYMQQRYYDPVCGCFLSVDPVTAYASGDWRQFNRYAYAYNNPYKFTDPDGRCPMCIAPIVFGVMAMLHSEPANAPAPGERTEGGSPADVFAAIPGGRAISTVKTTANMADKIYKSGARFTQAQKRAILRANRERNGGELKSDKSGQVLQPAQQSTRGVTPPANEAHVDHVNPRAAGGTNDPKNAQVLSREENLKKSDKIEK